MQQNLFKKIFLVYAALLLGVCTSTAQYTDIHDFNDTGAVGNANGASPSGNLTLVGNELYGMTQVGGGNNFGVIFSIRTNGTGYRDLHDFDNTHGGGPQGSLTLLGKKFYGMAYSGGANGWGCIFSMDTNGANYKDLWDFVGGGNPWGSLTPSYTGDTLFGMTNNGGNVNAGNIFCIDTNGTGYTDLYDFTGGNDGNTPWGSLTLLGRKLYGMTFEGGSNALGNIFSINTDGTGINDMHDFGNGSDGGNPWGDLTLSATGDTLFGMTIFLGQNFDGNIFSITTSGSGYTDLFDFNNGASGANPEGDLTLIGSQLYGMTQYAGTRDSGTIFSILTNSHRHHIIHQFLSPTGGSPYGSLTISNGVAYGMTWVGGANNLGVVFSDTLLKLSSTDTNVTCSGYGHGTVYVSEASPIKPYAYSWSPGGGTYDTAIFRSGGTYTVTATDSTGLSVSTTLIIADSASLISASASIIDSVICPHDSAHISITASGSAGITYLWNTGETTSSISVSPAGNATYSVSVCGKCDTVKLSKSVVVVPLPSPSISGKHWECPGGKDTLTASGGNTYLWSNGSTNSSYYTGNINADSSIILVAYNTLGCADTTNFTVTERVPATINLTPASTYCAGSPDVLNAVATGTGPFTYIWAPGGATTATINVSPNSVTTYTVTVSNGCSATATSIVTPDSPVLSACCDETITLGNDTVIAAAGSNIKNYQWTPNIGLSCDTCAAITVSPTITTAYTVTGTDSAGCYTQRVVTITIEAPCADFTVPNVFTPANAGPFGYNNVLYIMTNHIDSWSMYIYDRWGVEVYRSGNPKEYWTGTTEGSSSAPSGVYYYIISATCQGKTYKKDGFVQLIR